MVVRCMQCVWVLYMAQPKVGPKLRGRSKLRGKWLQLGLPRREAIRRSGGRSPKGPNTTPRNGVDSRFKCDQPDQHIQATKTGREAWLRQTIRSGRTDSQAGVWDEHSPVRSAARADQHIQAEAGRKACGWAPRGQTPEGVSRDGQHVEREGHRGDGAAAQRPRDLRVRVCATRHALCQS